MGLKSQTRIIKLETPTKINRIRKKEWMTKSQTKIKSLYFRLAALQHIQFKKNYIFLFPNNVSPPFESEIVLIKQHHPKCITNSH